MRKPLPPLFFPYHKLLAGASQTKAGKKEVLRNALFFLRGTDTLLAWSSLPTDKVISFLSHFQVVLHSDSDEGTQINNLLLLWGGGKRDILFSIAFRGGKKVSPSLSLIRSISRAYVGVDRAEKWSGGI